MNGFSLKIGDNIHKGDYKNIIVEDFSLSIEKKILFDFSELKIIYGINVICTRGKKRIR